MVVGNGSASELLGSNASYTATITPAASGTVTVDIAAGAAQDGAGNPSAAAVQFSIVADLTPVPALPVIGAVALALLLLVGGGRRQTARLNTAGGGRTRMSAEPARAGRARTTCTVGWWTQTPPPAPRIGEAFEHDSRTTSIAGKRPARGNPGVRPPARRFRAGLAAKEPPAATSRAPPSGRQDSRAPNVEREPADRPGLTSRLARCIRRRPAVERNPAVAPGTTA